MKLPEEAKKIEIFPISKMFEEDEHSPSEFYYTEDLETFDVETETASPYTKQLTNRACSGRTGEYWRSVRAATTSVRPSRPVSRRLIPYP